MSQLSVIKEVMHTAVRKTSAQHSWHALTQTIADTTKAFKVQQEGIQLCWEKLTKSEKLADHMVEKIVNLTSNLNELDNKLSSARSAVCKKRTLCDDLKQMIEFSKKRLHRSGEESKWMEFHTNEMDTRLSANAFAMKKYDEERRKYQQHLQRVLSESHDVRHKLEDAEGGVQYIQKLRDRLENNHKEDLEKLSELIGDTVKARTDMMSTKPDAMKNIVIKLLPDERGLNNLAYETEDMKNKGILLRMRLQEQSKEMVYLHSRNSELSLKISNISSKINKAREQKTGRTPNGNANAHALPWNRNPLTWFEAPKSDVDKLKEFLVKRHGREAEARIVQYMDVKTALESRWLIQMFEKDFVEYEKTLEILSMFSARKKLLPENTWRQAAISSSLEQDMFQGSEGQDYGPFNECEDFSTEI